MPCIIVDINSRAPRSTARTNGYSELAGYMPARGDFNSEYDNKAELLVTDIDFHSRYKDSLSGNDLDLSSPIISSLYDKRAQKQYNNLLQVKMKIFTLM